MRPLAPLAFLLLFSAGCVDVAAQRAAVLATTVGLGETDVVRRFGVPTRTYDVGGRRFLDHDDRRLVVLPGFAGFGGGFGYGRSWGPGFGAFDYVPPEVVERGCDTTFELDNGRVVSWALRGRACV